MVQDVEFLFDNHLISELQKLITNSKKHLLIVSPYIDLDARIMDALNTKKDKPNFKLQVLFGKNENNIYKSIKKNSLEYFKQFPNVEIRYNERLHAKFYLNDFEYILTSLNLYDFSLANNIEVGIKCVHANKGLIGKAFDATGNLIVNGIDSVKHDVLGYSKEVDPLIKFKEIFESSVLKYKTQPIVAEKSGITGLIGSKKLQGFDVKVNEFDSISQVYDIKEVEVEAITTTITSTTQTVIEQVRYISASKLAKNYQLPKKDITMLMEKKGLIKDGKITEIGKLKGLITKIHLEKEYIAYPENLEELGELHN